MELIEYLTKKEKERLIQRMERRELFHKELTRLRWKLKKSKKRKSLSSVSRDMGMNSHTLPSMFSDYNTRKRGKYHYGTLYRVLEHLDMNPNPALLG